MAVEKMPGTYCWELFAEVFAAEIKIWIERGEPAVLLHAYDEFTRARVTVRCAVARHRFLQYESKWKT